MVCNSIVQLVVRLLGLVFLILLWLMLFLQGMKIIFVGLSLVRKIVLWLVLLMMFICGMFSVCVVLCIVLMYFWLKYSGGKLVVGISLYCKLCFLQVVVIIWWILVIIEFRCFGCRWWKFRVIFILLGIMLCELGQVCRQLIVL